MCWSTLSLGPSGTGKAMWSDGVSLMVRPVRYRGFQYSRSRTGVPFDLVLIFLLHMKRLILFVSFRYTSISYNVREVKDFDFQRKTRQSGSQTQVKEVKTKVTPTFWVNGTEVTF